MRPFSILRQSGTSAREPIIVNQHALVADVPILASSLDALCAHKEQLRHGDLLPVGSVEFIRSAMAFAGISEPVNISYPEALFPCLHRNVRLVSAGSVLGTWFVKPASTKAFTGFVFDTLSDQESLSEHDREQYEVFMALPADTKVWQSEPVGWLSEYRYYVLAGEVLGAARYDDGPDDAPVPDDSAVQEMAAKLAGIQNAPIAFSLDVGVLNSGETALVECNDAWALGYYTGTLSRKDYVEMLWQRWNQLLLLRDRQI